MRNRTSTTGGFSVVELMVVAAVVMAVAFVFLSVAPAFRWREYDNRTARATCDNNLKQIGLAFKTWALDNKDRYPMQVPEAEGGPPNQAQLMQPDPVAAFTYQIFGTMSNELSTPKILVCPSDNSLCRANFLMVRDGTSNQVVAGQTTLCNLNLSYFVGRDAGESSPAMPLAGDRNIYGGGLIPHNFSNSKINGGYGNSPIHAGASYSPGFAAAMGTNLTAGDSSACWTGKMHRGQGNVLLSDGSVQHMNNVRLRALLAASGDTNAPPRQNMLLFP